MTPIIIYALRAAPTGMYAYLIYQRNVMAFMRTDDSRVSIY